MPETFDKQLSQIVQQSLLGALKKTDWLSVAWKGRPEIPSSFLRECYESADMGRVKAIISEKIEQRIADAMFNSMATECAKDVKKVMCNTELREECRAVIREKIRKLE